MPKSYKHLYLALSHTLSRNTTQEESFDNLTSKLVEVHMSAPPYQLIGSGLLLTEDGFILTANHVIERHLDALEGNSFIIHDGKRYPLDLSIYATDAHNDIAIIKSNISNNPRTINYIVKQDNLKEGDEIRVFAPINSDIRYSIGQVRKADNKIETSALIRKGYSGGVCFTFNEYRPAELAGIIVAGYDYINNKEQMPAICTPIHYARSLVLELCRKIDKIRV